MSEKQPLNKKDRHTGAKKAARVASVALALSATGLAISETGSSQPSAHVAGVDTLNTETHGQIVNSFDDAWGVFSSVSSAFTKTKGNSSSAVNVSTNPVQFPNEGGNGKSLSIQSSVYDKQTNVKQVFDISVVTPDSSNSGAEPNSMFNLTYYEDFNFDQGPRVPGKVDTSDGKLIYSFGLEKAEDGEWGIAVNYGDGQAPLVYTTDAANPANKGIPSVQANKEIVGKIMQQASGVLEVAKNHVFVEPKFPEPIEPLSPYNS